jgi:hypothetical protein
VAKPPDDDGLSGPAAGTRTARSKFLEAVKAFAEANHLELVVEWEGPNTGYGCIQKADGFSNYYSFHFEFGGKFAVFYLGSDSVEAATPEQRRQVEYKDGGGMELVLQEIREKIGEATRGAFPQLKALSSTRAEPPDLSANVPKVSQSKTDAIVWGQDMRTLDADRYRHRKPPRRGHMAAIVAVILLVLVLFALAPVLGANRGITECHDASCQTSTAYYQSASFRMFGVGGVYVPRSNGTGLFSSGTLQATNGTRDSGLSLDQFYIAW